MRALWPALPVAAPSSAQQASPLSLTWSMITASMIQSQGHGRELLTCKIDLWHTHLATGAATVEILAGPSGSETGGGRAEVAPKWPASAGRPH
jgi:hypothetical protein